MAEPAAWLALDAKLPLAWLGELATAMPAVGAMVGGAVAGGAVAKGAVAKGAVAKGAVAEGALLRGSPPDADPSGDASFGAVADHVEVPPSGWRLHTKPIARLLGAWALLVLAIGMTPAGDEWAELPRPVSAGAVLLGLFLIGSSLAGASPVSGRARLSVRMLVSARRGALLLVLAWAADGAASGWGVLRPAPPWAPEVASALLDLSPRTLLMESGGVDWMRHPSVYESAGTDRIGPGLRSVYVGPVAGSVTLLVGCLALAARSAVSRRLARP